MVEEPIGIGEKFLQQMDEYISSNYQTMTCQDMYDIYKGFFDTLKTFRSVSHGFTGFPESVMFRFVLHALGGKFRYEPITKDTMRFVSTTDERLVIGQSIKMNVKGKNKYPDILIQYDKKPFSVIAIKTVLTNGEKTIKQELENFNYYREEYPELNALLLIFWEVKETAKCYPVLEKLNETHQRNNFLILNNEKNKNDPLLRLLNNYLKLPELTKKILPIQR